MSRILALAMVLIALAAGAPGASACPYCGSEVGREVAAGIFNGEFAINASLTLLPFPVLLGLVAVVYFGRWPAGESGDSAALQEVASSRAGGEELR